MKHQGPLQCATHRGVIDDFGCPVWNCDDDHPMKTTECGLWCADFAQPEFPNYNLNN